MRNFIKKPQSILILLLLAAFFIRLYHFDAPVGDWHSWRQADTSAVTRNLYKTDFDVLHPRFDDLSNVPSGMDNPMGYRFVEFPVYNLLSAFIHSLSFGLLSVEQSGRLVSIISTLSIIVLLYLLVKKYLNETAALLTAGFYTFTPYTIYYGRAILPDTTMAAAILAGIYFFDRFATAAGVTKTGSKKRTYEYRYFLLAVVCTASAFLLKPYALFFVLPMVVIAWNTWGKKLFWQWKLYVFVVLTITPFILWRLWMTQYPEGIPANQWLLNGNGIRFRPAFFRWIGYERVIKLISGYAGVMLLIASFYQLKRTKQALFFLSFLISSAAYTVIFATGNVQHDYYQIIIMPTIAMFMGLGAYGILVITKRFSSYLGPVILLIIAVCSFYFGWKQVKDYFNINNRAMITVGKIVDLSVPPDAQVIALYQGDTSFLYQTKRQGWTSFQNPLPEMIEKGADYLVQLDPTPYDVASYQTEYTVVASGSGYILIKLH